MKQDTVDAIGRYGLIALTVTTLFALLTYTFVHTGGLLSEYVEPYQVGYIAAFGIEAAIITMSIRLGKLLRQLAHDGYQGRETWLSFIWQGLTLLFVLAVSAIANIVEGHKVKHGVELTLTTIQNLDGLQILIGLVATGVIPVVVLAMTEIVSGEVKAMMGTGGAPLQVADAEPDAIEADVQIVAPALQPVMPHLIADLQPMKEPVKTVQVDESAMQEDLQPVDLWGDMSELVAEASRPAGVSADTWQAYRMCKFQGMSQSDVAAIMGKSVSTISRYCTKVDEVMAREKVMA